MPTGCTGFRERGTSRLRIPDRPPPPPLGGAHLTSSEPRSEGCQMVADGGHQCTSLWLCSCTRPTGSAVNGNLNVRRKGWEVGLVQYPSHPHPIPFGGISVQILGLAFGQAFVTVNSCSWPHSSEFCASCPPLPRSPPVETPAVRGKSLLGGCHMGSLERKSVRPIKHGGPRSHFLFILFLVLISELYLTPLEHSFFF